MGIKWTTLSIFYIMKLKHNITLGKILCVYTDQDPNTIYSYANYSMTFELMTLSVNHEPKIEKPFLSYTPIYQDFISCSCRTVHSLPYSFRTYIIQWSHFLPYRCTTMPVNPALRIHVQSQPGLYEFEAIWPIEGQPISKIQKEISDKEFKS